MPVIGQRLRDEANVVLTSKKKGASKKGQHQAHRDPNGHAHNPTNLSKQYTDSSNRLYCIKIPSEMEVAPRYNC